MINSNPANFVLTSSLSLPRLFGKHGVAGNERLVIQRKCFGLVSRCARGRSLALRLRREKRSVGSHWDAGQEALQA